MEIKPRPASPSLLVTPASVPTVARAWTAGRIIEALVLRADPARGTVVLQLAEGEVEARSELPLQPGTRLQLTPERGDGNRLLLRLRDAGDREPLLAALRHALPREAPIAPVFETVERLLRSPTAANLPEPVRREALALTRAAPTPERLTTPDGLRDALRDAGLMLESRLADPTAPPPVTDLKARLLALLATLAAPRPHPAAPGAPAVSPPSPPAPLPPHAVAAAPAPSAPAEESPPVAATPVDEPLDRLARHVEGALSRIQLHQLQALPDNSPAPQWLFELPVHTGQGSEPLLLRFERDGEREGATADGPGWRVTLDLSHPDFGALRAVLSWRGGELATRFFAERETTAERFRQHLTILSDRLAAAGIPVASLESHAGIPAAAPRRTAPLLSERA